MALRDSMRETAAPYLHPGEPIQAVIGAQTASQYMAALGGIFVFLGLNRYRILVVTPSRILVLDTGKVSQKKARGVVGELPRPATRNCACTAGSSRTSRPPTRRSPASEPARRRSSGCPNRTVAMPLQRSGLCAGLIAAYCPHRG
jgi:hypothetical protein